eukprot:s3873_g1.t2
MTTSILGNSAMAAAVEAGRQWLVPKMLRALRSDHVQIDVVSYNICVSSYEKHLGIIRYAVQKFWRGSLQLLQEAVVSSCVDGTTYEAALTNCRDDWKRTFLLLSKLPRKWRSLSCLNSAMGEEPWEQSMELMVVMKHQEVEADVITHKAMISSFGRGMQWKATLGELIPLRQQALTALDRGDHCSGI